MNEEESHEILASDYVMTFEHVSSHQLCGYLYKNQANQNFKIMEGSFPAPSTLLPIGEVISN